MRRRNLAVPRTGGCIRLLIRAAKMEIPVYLFYSCCLTEYQVFTDVSEFLGYLAQGRCGRSRIHGDLLASIVACVGFSAYSHQAVLRPAVDVR